MTKYLILDTSSNLMYLSISNGKEIYTKTVEGRNNHSEKVMELIEEGLTTLGLEVGDLEKIVCGIGPGSYTGLRVSLTVCKMFAWMKDIPLFALSSLDILGSGYFLKDGKYTICNLAKKDYVNYKEVNVNCGKIETVVADKFGLYNDVLSELKDATLISENDYKFNDEVILKMANKRVSNVHDITPNYLREALS